MSKNVAIIGESGVGKSSLINMICHGANAPTSNDRTGCTKEGKEYPCNLGGQLSCQVHDTIGLEEGRWGFFPDKKSQKKLKTYLKDSREPWHFVVYCIPGGRGHLKKSHGKNYEKVKSMMDSVPLVVVVTHLEDFKDPLDRWWSDNQSTLRKLGIPDTTKHACVTTLPKHALETFYQKGDLYDNSCRDVQNLIRSILWPAIGRQATIDGPTVDMPTTERPATEKPTTERPTTDRSFLDVDATAPSDQFGGVDELSSTFFADIDSGSPMGGAHPHSRVNALLAHLSSHLHRFRPKNGEATELPQPSRLSAFHPHSLHTRLSSLIHRSSPENDASDELQQPSTPSLLNPHVLLARLSSFLPPPPLNAHKEAEPHPTTPLSSSPDGLISSLSSRFRSQPHTNEGIELPQRPSRPRVVAVAAMRDKQTLVVARGPYFQKAKRAYEQQTQLHSQAQASSSHTEPATASMYAMRPAPACTAAAQPLVIEWWTKIVLFLCCCASPANSS